MRTIYKYPLEVADRQTITVSSLLSNGEPTAPEFLCAALQNGLPCIWALVDSDAPGKPYTVTMCGTGARCDCTQTAYIGTLLLMDGNLVLHVFVERK